MRWIRSSLRRSRRALWAAAFVLPASASAQDVTVRIIEEPYRPVYAFLGVYFETLGVQRAEQAGVVLSEAPQIGFGVRLMSARQTSIQFESGIGFRQVTLDGFAPDKASFFDMVLGGRLYPLTPSFVLGNLAFRVTAAARGGLTIGDVLGPAMDVSAGLAMSSGRDPNGLVIEWVGRPLEYQVEDLDGVMPDALLRPSWMIRAGFQFGPG